MPDYIYYEKCTYCGTQEKNLFKWSSEKSRAECTTCGWTKYENKKVAKVDYYNVKEYKQSLSWKERNKYYDV